MFFSSKATTVPAAQECLPGRSNEIPTAEMHFVSGRPLKGPIRRGWSRPCSGWAVFGVWSGYCGTLRAFG